MSLRQLQFRILCLACTLFGCALTLTGQTPDIIGLEKPFPPLEKWRSAIVAGDASSLRLLYSTNPVAHIQTASGTVDSDAAVHYWIDVFGGREWDVMEEIPNDSAAALILLEHHWAVPLRDAIARAGGFRISDGFISPLDLVEIGLATGEEAKELHTMEHAAGKH